MKRAVTCLAAAASLVSASVLAQPTPEDRAVAEALFQDARRLMEEKRFAAACPKLEEAQRLAPAGGSLLNLAACHEATGRIAAAWAEYRDAETQAKKAGRRDREKIAHDRSEALAPLVPKLVIVVGAPIAALGPRITRDATEVGAAAWGAEIPLDPGPHSLRATAPGHVAWEAVVELEIGKVSRVTVPPLELVPAPPAKASASPPPAPPSASMPVAAPPPPVPPPPEGPSAPRITGFALLGAGALSLGVGTYFGVRALSSRADSDAHCLGASCTPGGFAANEDARTQAHGSNLFLLFGVALASGGVALVVTSPRPAPVEVSLVAPGALRVRW